MRFFDAALFFLVWVCLAGAEENESGHREKRLAGLFSVVRFENSECDAGDGKSGICYNKQECKDRGGEASGTCANNFGTCCYIKVGCGSQINDNCTYFQEASPKVGDCSAKICTGEDICRIRLDFVTFDIAGPATTTHTGGVFEASQRTLCLTDTFGITSRSQAKTQSICGINTGEHMYVDADRACNVMKFQLGSTGIGTQLPSSRSWNIKVTHYSCDFENLAPEGCTQYFYGSDDQAVRTFNFQGGLHLGNQRQRVCVRRERNVCRLCWTPTTATDFQVSATSMLSSGLGGRSCCSFGGSLGGDCLRVSGDVELPDGTPQSANSFCGRQVIGATVCQTSGPFSVNFQTDGWEFPVEFDIGNKGIELTYIQDPC